MKQDGPIREKLIAIDWSSHDLPTLPSVAYKLMAMARDVNSSPEDLSNLIERDPTLTVKILKAVNSAFYSLSMEITSIKHAIVLLGMDEVRKIAIGSLLAERFLTIPKEVRPEAESLWQHILATAILAQDFTYGGEDDPDLYTLGLLHDIGWLVLLTQAPTIFKALVVEENNSREETEKAWGVNHQLWGAKLAEHWQLPEPFQIVALHHHKPLEVINAPKYLMIINLANHLANTSGFNLLNSPPEPVHKQVLEALELDDNTLVELERAAWEDRIRIAQLCKILSG